MTVGSLSTYIPGMQRVQSPLMLMEAPSFEDSCINFDYALRNDNRPPLIRTAFYRSIRPSGAIQFVSDYSPGQARGGSDDCILSASVHHMGFGMKLSARASSLYVQAIPKDCRIIGRFSYCFQHGEGIVNPTCCLCYAVLSLIPLFITVILLSIIYCSNLRYFACNSSKYRLHLYLLMFCRSVPMQYIKNDEYQSR